MYNFDHFTRKQLTHTNLVNVKTCDDFIECNVEIIQEIHNLSRKGNVRKKDVLLIVLNTTQYSSQYYATLKISTRIILQNTEEGYILRDESHITPKWLHVMIVVVEGGKPKNRSKVEFINNKLELGPAQTSNFTCTESKANEQEQLDFAHWHYIRHM